jgi:pimeloyl-ACP methyl ester carboxylesterase
MKDFLTADELGESIPQMVWRRQRFFSLHIPRELPSPDDALTPRMRFVRTPDDRRLLTEQRGDPRGTAYVLLHGSPSSLFGMQIYERDLVLAGVQTLTFNRAGYFGSDPNPGRDVASVAKDIATVLDDYSITEACVIGRSGGGSAALKFAEDYPERTTAAITLAGLKEARSVGDPSFSADMVGENADAFSEIENREQRRNEAEAVLHDRHLPPPPDGLTDADKLILKVYPMLRRVLDCGIVGGLMGDGAEGWSEDIEASGKPWGPGPRPSPKKIPPTIPVILYQPMQDRFTPPAHAEALQERIPHAQVYTDPFGGHIGATLMIPYLMELAQRGMLHEPVPVPLFKY